MPQCEKWTTTDQFILSFALPQLFIPPLNSNDFRKSHTGIADVIIGKSENLDMEKDEEKEI